MTLTSSIPVLRVSDYPRAKAFWTEALGFECIEEGGDPARFGIFRRDAATVFVDAWHGADPETSPGWRAYFHIDDVDAFAASLDWRPIIGPGDKPYGMRELEVLDPDGNRLCFGQDI
ncbi:MAG: glyoxalase superfamily protein [Paracoccaceae bacterium]|nr:glyoxalase superfamily protein [Paracoccaceae bacterium]